MRFEELTGRQVVIWGAGREGRAAHAELTRRGVPSVLVVTGDGAVPDSLADVVRTGEAALECLATADVVLKSPGIPRASREFRQVTDRGIPVTSLTDLWLNDNQHRVIAVTGTKGKSTTAALIHHALSTTGVSAALVGNLGTPVTEGDQDGAQVAVTEVSSYQAADLSSSPFITVLTSLYPEHLPWHGSFEQYVEDKLNLFAHGPQVVVVPDDADELAALVAQRVGPETRVIGPADLGLSVTDEGVSWHEVGTLPRRDVPLQGGHNLANLALALTAVGVYAELRSADRAAVLASVRSFAPLAHRLETVPSADGRTWVDDSLATAPEAVVAALETYPSNRVVLLVGGADRQLSFAPLIDYLARRTESAPVAAIAVGPAGARFAAEAADRVRDVQLAPNFATALAWAGSDPAGSDLVLLSPGAPSFDEFASYEERSRAFRAAALGGSTAESR